MTEDLYKLLKINRTVPKSAIRTAYRKMAKQCHPDTGGDPETFARLKLAHDVLCDTERRRRYDETGEIEPTKADNAYSNKLGCLSMVLGQTLFDIAQAGGKPEETDLVAAIHAKFEKLILDNQKGMDQLDSNIGVLTRLLGRWSTKGGDKSPVELVIEGQISQFENTKVGLRRRVDELRDADELLADTRFRADVLMRAQWGGVSMFTTV